jgi:hypothetical protein
MRTTLRSPSMKTASIANRMKNMWMLRQGSIHRPSPSFREARPRSPRVRDSAVSATAIRSPRGRPFASS